jgi:hypothetical protein
MTEQDMSLTREHAKLMSNGELVAFLVTLQVSEQQIGAYIYLRNANVPCFLPPTIRR